MKGKGYTHLTIPQARQLLMEDRQLPDFGLELQRVSYADGCKVCFQGGGWVLARFSGTEPLLRVFCERDAMDKAAETAACMERFLGLAGRNME